VTTPIRSAGELWWQAFAETRTLPSWEAGQACRRRYDELLRAHGYVDANGTPAQSGDRPMMLGHPGALEPWAQTEADKHQPESGGGCTCRFCMWSVEHVVIMSIRDAWPNAWRHPLTPPLNGSSATSSASPVTAGAVRAALQGVSDDAFVVVQDEDGHWTPTSIEHLPVGGAPGQVVLSREADRG
jgi:hypothetical protein